MTKQEAISLLTEEVRMCRMAPKINGCPMTEDWKRTIEVCEIDAYMENPNPYRPREPRERQASVDELSENQISFF